MHPYRHPVLDTLNLSIGSRLVHLDLLGQDHKPPKGPKGRSWDVLREQRPSSECHHWHHWDHQGRHLSHLCRLHHVHGRYGLPVMQTCNRNSLGHSSHQLLSKMHQTCIKHVMNRDRQCFLCFLKACNWPLVTIAVLRYLSQSFVFTPVPNALESVGKHPKSNCSGASELNLHSTFRAATTAATGFGRANWAVCWRPKITVIVLLCDFRPYW